MHSIKPTCGEDIATMLAAFARCLAFWSAVWETDMAAVTTLRLSRTKLLQRGLTPPLLSPPQPSLQPQGLGQLWAQSPALGDWVLVRKPSDGVENEGLRLRLLWGKK